MFRSRNLIDVSVNYAVQVTPRHAPSVNSFEREAVILYCILYTSVIFAWESSAKPSLQISASRPSIVRPHYCEVLHLQQVCRYLLFMRNHSNTILVV